MFKIHPLVAQFIEATRHRGAVIISGEFFAIAMWEDGSILEIRIDHEGPMTGLEHHLANEDAVEVTVQPPSAHFDLRQ